MSQHAHFRRALLASLILASCASAQAALPENPALKRLETPLSARTDRLIVKFRQSGKSVDFAAKLARVQELTERLGVEADYLRTTATGAQVLKLEGLQPLAEVEALARQLSAQADVEYAEADLRMEAYLTPNDTRYAEQWHYFDRLVGINAEPAWDISRGEGVTVAVIDTGYRPHADLAGNVIGGYDFINDPAVAGDGDGRDADARDPGDFTLANECGEGIPGRGSSWHGSHVAGTIAALSNNALGVAGVAHKAKILPVRALGKCGGYSSDIADGIVWSAGGSVPGVPANPNPAKVINMSLGGKGLCSSSRQAAIDSARARGAVIVVAAGNSNDDVFWYTPANCKGVVTVAATNTSGGRAWFSNYGDAIDVAAPGVNILSTVDAGTLTPAGDGYKLNNGTSMAAPHVAGVAALLLSRFPSLTPDNVEAALKGSGRAFPSACNGCGTGIVDARAALNLPTGVATKLDNGVSVANIGAPVGVNQHYVLNVPTGTQKLLVETRGGSGDLDLFLRYGGTADAGQFDCKSATLGSNTEVCVIANPQAGNHYIALNATAAFSGASLTAWAGLGELEPNDYRSKAQGLAASGATVLADIATLGDMDYYRVELPAGKTLTVDMKPNAGGDYDLVAYDSYGIKLAYSYNAGKGTAEKLTLSNPASTTATRYILVNRFAGSTGHYSLRAAW